MKMITETHNIKFFEKGGLKAISAQSKNSHYGCDFLLGEDGAFLTTYMSSYKRLNFGVRPDYYMFNKVKNRWWKSDTYLTDMFIYQIAQLEMLYHQHYNEKII